MFPCELHSCIGTVCFCWIYLFCLHFLYFCIRYILICFHVTETVWFRNIVAHLTIPLAVNKEEQRVQNWRKVIEKAGKMRNFFFKIINIALRSNCINYF